MTKPDLVLRDMDMLKSMEDIPVSVSVSFNDTTDTLIMNRKTYVKVLAFGSSKASLFLIFSTGIVY